MFERWRRRNGEPTIIKHQDDGGVQNDKSAVWPQLWFLQKKYNTYRLIDLIDIQLRQKFGISILTESEDNGH